MTSGPSLAFSTMEIPGIDDTMEMASPYQGHIDDLDIDLDIMEDQASTTDKDMMGDDEYNHETSFEQDGTNDADMIDDIVEQAMIDTDEPYEHTDYNIEMQYGQDKTYEAEMLEDDYDEDIDAPVGEVPHEAPSSAHQKTQAHSPSPIEHQTSGNDGEESTTRSQPETNAESVPETHQVDTNPSAGHDNGVDDSKSGAQQYEIPQSPTDQTEKPLDFVSSADQDSAQTVHLDYNEDGYVNVENPEQEEGINKASEIPAVQTEGTHNQEEEDKESWETGDKETEENQTQEQEQKQSLGVTEQVQALYPVKVYYQDNEISLFPPREGDSSETYFLEDESLSREPLSRLFSSCREVLGDHVGENEVLVLDVDCLNLQLTEDAAHSSKVTLYQIVELYLRLCHNDGVDKPEALYLTLSTRLTIAAEISDLLVAANEGKGLSEIYIWDGYQEADAVSTEIPADHEDEQLAAEFKDEHISAEGQNLEAPTDVDPETHTNSFNPESQGIEEPAPDNHHDQEAGPEEKDGDASASYKNEEFAPSENAEECISYSVSEAEEAQKTGVLPQEILNENQDHHSPEDGSYDSEEQNTESTTTIAQLPTLEPTDAPQQQEDVIHVSVTDHTAEEREIEFHDEDLDEEEYGEEEEEEGEVNLNPTEDADKVDQTEDGDSGDDYGNNEPDLYVGESYYEDAEAYDHTHIEDVTADSVPQDNEVDTEATLRGDETDTLHQASDPLVASLNGSETNSAHQSGLDENLGVADGVENPSKLPESDLNVGQSHESEDFHKELKQAPGDEESEPLIFDDEEFLDLEFTEELDASNEETDPKPSGSASIKRQRDAEDESELATSPSPDAKRSRSS